MGRRASENPSPDAIRKRRQRERRERGVVLRPIEISAELEAALLQRGDLTPKDLANPDDLAAVLGWTFEKYANVDQ